MPATPLTRERILDKAISLLRQRGVEGLSIRRLAGLLHVTPMAIYRYFDDKDALLAALVDRYIENAEVLPSEQLPWDRWILHVGCAMYDALVTERDAIWLFRNLRFTTQGMDVIAACVEVFVGAGFSEQDALKAFYAMLHASIGAALLETSLHLFNPDVYSAPQTPTLDPRLQAYAINQDDIIKAHDLKINLQLIVKAFTQKKGSC